MGNTMLLCVLLGFALLSLNIGCSNARSERRAYAKIPSDHGASVSIRGYGSFRISNADALRP